jgi:hypothetical protein
MCIYDVLMHLHLRCRLVSAPVRVNMVVALADLASRWPNVLEPWTAYMYEPLSGMRRSLYPRAAAGEEWV